VSTAKKDGDDGRLFHQNMPPVPARSKTPAVMPIRLATREWIANSSRDKCPVVDVTISVIGTGYALPKFSGHILATRNRFNTAGRGSSFHQIP
jgi:hypothetical protein